jgi:hypothetical protein
VYSDFDEDLLLGAEATVVLPVDAELDDQPDGDPAEAHVSAHRTAWARHALRSNGFGGAVSANDAPDDDDLTMRDVIRQIFAVRWD